MEYRFFIDWTPNERNANYRLILHFLLRQGHLVVQYLHKHLEIFSSSILEREKC